MYVDEFSAFGGGSRGPVCCVCKEPIGKDERPMRIVFDTDPTGEKGFTGDYHAVCSKPFAALAQAINMMSRFGR
jgi:hypothetical protein